MRKFPRLLCLGRNHRSTPPKAPTRTTVRGRFRRVQPGRESRCFAAAMWTERSYGTPRRGKKFARSDRAATMSCPRRSVRRKASAQLLARRRHLVGRGYPARTPHLRRGRKTIYAPRSSVQMAKKCSTKPRRPLFGTPRRAKSSAHLKNRMKAAPSRSARTASSCSAPKNKENSGTLWDARTGKTVRVFPSGGESARLICGPDGKHVLACLLGEKPVQSLQCGFVGHRHGPPSSCVSRSNSTPPRPSSSPDGKLILAGAGEETAASWSADTGSRLRTFFRCKQARIDSGFQ